MLKLVGAFCMFCLFGCTTALIPGAEKVKVTREQAFVGGCKSLGFVDAKPPFSTPNDARNEMKNKTVLLGGNVLSVTNYSMKATGVAYSCELAEAARIP